jgi:non-lysosomal glucosylceramidase
MEINNMADLPNNQDNRNRDTSSLSAGPSRRDFLAAGAGTLALTLMDNCCLPAEEKLGTHHIPEDKNLSKAWVDSLFDKGQSKVYKGHELTIGMPVGGICTGQLYLLGDGRLGYWQIFNLPDFTGYGDNCYRTYTPPTPSPVPLHFDLSVIPGKDETRMLSDQGFHNVEFVGEYPIGQVRYVTAKKDQFHVEVSLEAFSPFIPLNAKESGIPGTVLRFKLHNTHVRPVEARLSGYLGNLICSSHVEKMQVWGRTTRKRSAGITSLVLSADETLTRKRNKVDKPEIFADFESGSYGNWKKTGTAFGDKPASGTLQNQQPVTGFGGKYLVNSFAGGDGSVGTLTSPEFTIKRDYINFKIGGGNHPGKTCINLLVDGKVVRTATGKNNEKLESDWWEVSDFDGDKARIEIVDREKGGWGHINVDDIEFADAPPKDAKIQPLNQQPDFGTMALSVLDEKALAAVPPDTYPIPSQSAGELTPVITIDAGETEEVVFLITWHFAKNEHGQAYGQHFKDALDVAKYLKDNLDRLTKLTRLFHDTYYDSTLPHWLLDRLMMPNSTLATGTCQWWGNGRFWAWEGVGCCNGTCTHVWNYAHGMARLFPELERSARTKQDLGPAFDPKTGRVGFRGEDPHSPYAADGQCGTVLKCYREHLMSKDDSFLKENWPRIKKVMEYEIGRDGNADGIIEDKQWNTYDLDFVGPNTFVGSLYLAALLAAAKMADLLGEADFASKCRAIAAKGSQWTVANLWNGEYFIQKIPPGTPTKFQYGDGCLADQLFGQNWANQLGLGHIYPRDKVRTAVQSIYKYNWAPDVAAQNKAYPPQRWFARPGEAGLFVCTWPKGGRMQEPVLYRDEVWTGGEYQLASHLLHEGMIREGLSIIRGIHDRYDGKRHNPWNEVECGDHYARALASWGCLIALCGFTYDGPAGRLGFAPRWQENDFKAFFTAAEGWGSLRQRRTDKSQKNHIDVKYGQVFLKELTFETPKSVKASEVSVSVGGQPIESKFEQKDRIIVALEKPVNLKAGETLSATIRW